MGAPDGLDSKTTLRTACSAATSLPTAPRCHEDIDLGKIPYGENGENCQKFLIGRHQQPGENKDIIILGTKKTVRQFCLSPFKSCDGTFSITPKLFYQAMIFLCMTNKAYILSMIALMPDKSRDSYDNMFGFLVVYFEAKNLDYSWVGAVFMTDFEVAMKSSILMFFPYVKLLACYFHFSQRIVYLLKASGLQTAYEKVPEFNAVVRRICSLPFVLKEIMVGEALSLIEKRGSKLKDQKQEEFVEAAVSLLKNTYINGTYCMDYWNMYDVDLTTVPVTNNGNEGWNSSSKTDYGTHPQANKFILTSCVLLEESEDNIMQLLYNSRKP